MTIETWLLFIAVAILPAISPGPAIFLALSNALRFGSRATVYSAGGNALGLVVVALTVAYGLGAIMAASATAFNIVKIVGALYLIYLGIKVWRDRSLLSTDEGKTEQPIGPKKPMAFFSEAFIVSVFNPKAYLMIGALFPLFMDLSAPVHTQVFVYSLTYAVMCWLNHLVLALLGGRMRQFFQSEKRMTFLRRGLGVGFVGFGAAMMTATR